MITKPEFSLGDYVIRKKGIWGKMEVDDIDKIVDIKLDEIKLEKFGGGHNPNKFRKATEEEITKYFTIKNKIIMSAVKTDTIIGWKAPCDLYKGEVKKGDVLSNIDMDNQYTDWIINGQKSNVSIPAEIVKQWEPVYEEEFKKGDYVVLTKITFDDEKNSFTEGKVYKLGGKYLIDGKGFYVESDNHGNENGHHGYSFRKATKEEIKKATEFKKDDWVIGWHNTSSGYKTNAWQIEKISDKYVYVKGTSNNTGIGDVRKATKGEIEKTTIILIGPYEAEFIQDSDCNVKVKFGCKKFSLAEVEALSVLFKKKDIQLSITGYEITQENIEKVLSLLKQKS